MRLKSQDKLNNLSTTHRVSFSVSFLSPPCCHSPSPSATSARPQIRGKLLPLLLLLLLILFLFLLHLPRRASTRLELVPHAPSCHMPHIHRRRLRCAPKLYARCTYPLWQIVCLSGCQSPAFPCSARLVSRFSTRFPLSSIGCRLSTAAALYLHKTATLCKNTHTHQYTYTYRHTQTA